MLNLINKLDNIMEILGNDIPINIIEEIYQHLIFYKCSEKIRGLMRVCKTFKSFTPPMNRCFHCWWLKCEYNLPMEDIFIWAYPHLDEITLSRLGAARPRASIHQ